MTSSRGNIFWLEIKMSMGRTCSLCQYLIYFKVPDTYILPIWFQPVHFRASAKAHALNQQFGASRASLEPHQVPEGCVSFASHLHEPVVFKIRQVRHYFLGMLILEAFSSGNLSLAARVVLLINNPLGCSGLMKPCLAVVMPTAHFKASVGAEHR